jgi:tripartite motif-containing protein 71
MNGRVMALVTVILVALGSTAAVADPPVSFSFGSRGSGEGEFDRPSAVAVDRAGDVYVADGGNHRVQKFDAAGAFLFQFGGWGDGEGQFKTPAAVAVDSVGHVYVADRDNHRVQKFDAAGAFLLQFGGSGAGAGRFHQPRGLAVDSADHVYVLSTGGLERFDPVGVLRASLPLVGSPSVFAVDRVGNLILYDPARNTFEVLDATGRLLARVSAPRCDLVSAAGCVDPDGPGPREPGDGQFHPMGPQALAVDDLGQLYVADSGNRRIQQLAASGEFLRTVGGSGAAARETGESAGRPAGLALDAAGRLYVADAEQHRVQVLGPAADTRVAPSRDATPVPSVIGPTAVRPLATRVEPERPPDRPLPSPMAPLAVLAGTAGGLGLCLYGVRRWS